jgi:hypothetical protein
MATGGGKPGITAKVKVVEVTATRVTFQFKDDDASYFEVGHGYVAQFQPTPPEHSGGDGEKPKDS